MGAEGPVLGFQVGCMAAIFATCFVGALLPIQFTRWFREHQGKVLSFANCLGGGILLGASFVHLMSDAEEENGSTGVPSSLSHFIAAVGFLVSFILERMLFNDEGHGHGHGGHDHVVFIEDHHHASKGDPESFTSKTEDADASGVAPHPHADEAAVEMRLLHPAEPEVEVTAVGEDPEEAEVKTKKRPHHGHGEHEHKHEHKHEHDQEHEDEHEHEHEHEQAPGEPATGHEYRFSHLEAGHHHDHIVHTQKRSKVPYMLFAVLGLESAISGSALGVQVTITQTLVTFLAIVTHIWAEAFTLSTALLKGRVSVSITIKAMLGFSCITPAAIAVGMGVGQLLEASAVAVVSSILISFAAGTFIFVATMEIMVEEFANPHHKWTKLALLLGGFGFMSVLGFVV